MRVRFWGTRGSVASAGRPTVRFGGNTACVDVRADDGTQFVLDCGTGARELGLALLRDDPPQRIHLLVTHTHWDHIQGFPFFAPVYVPHIALTVFGSPGLERTLEASLAGQMEHTYFPVNLHELRARLDFREVTEGRLVLGATAVRSQYLNHTALTLGYRLEAGGASVVYATDHEPFWWEEGRDSFAARLAHPGDARHADFLRGADLLIHDAQYTDAEYPNRRGWGHSTVEYVVDLACLAGVKRLALFHHDPSRDDEAVERIVMLAQARARDNGAPLEVLAAAEGLEIALSETDPDNDPGSDAMAPPPLLKGRPVLVATDDPLELARIGEALAGDGYRVTLAASLDQAEDLARREHPHLAVLAFGARMREAAPIVEALRAHTAAYECPVIAIVDDRDRSEVRRLEALSVDVLSRPWAPAMLRTRVRVWLARAGRDQGATEGSAPTPAVLVSDSCGPIDTGAAADHHRPVPLLEPTASLQLQPGQALFHEGDPAGGVYLIRAGRLALSTTAPSGGTFTLDVAEPGETVGELAALDGLQRGATAIALEPTLTDYVSREAFLRGLAESPPLAAHVIRLLASRLRRASQAIRRIAARERAASIALGLLVPHLGDAAGPGTGIGDLASTLRLDVEETRKALASFVQRGAIEVKGDQVVVLDPELLLAALRE